MEGKRRDLTLQLIQVTEEVTRAMHSKKNQSTTDLSLLQMHCWIRKIVWEEFKEKDKALEKMELIKEVDTYKLSKAKEIYPHTSEKVMEDLLIQKDLITI